MIRATTGGVLRSYRSNLMKSFISQNNAMNTILTQRTFNSYAEDPASAAKAFRLRKSRMTVQSQYNTCNNVQKKYETGASCLQSIDDLLDTKDGVPGAYMKTLKGTTLSMLNDPEGDAREQLNKVLDQLSEMLVQDMNQKYGDNFIFAGADGHNVPFEVKDNKLYYRGVPVDAAELKLMEDGAGNKLTVTGNGDLNGNYVLANAKTEVALPERKKDNDGNPSVVVLDDGNHYYVKDSATGPISQDDYDALTEDEQAKYESFSVFTPPFAEEAPKVYYHTEDDLILKDTYDAVYDSVLKDDDGEPYTTNIDGVPHWIVEGWNDATISKDDYEQTCKDAEKLKYLSNEKMFVDIGLGFQETENNKLIESSAFNAALNGINFLGYGLDADGDPKNLYSLVQKMKEVSESVPEAGKWDDPTWDEFDRLVGKFETACSSFKTEFTNMDASSTKLGTNSELLEENFYNLQEQYADLEDIEPVEAINNFLWAQYAYNAALKVGNSVLSQSLMDYLS